MSTAMKALIGVVAAALIGVGAVVALSGGDDDTSTTTVTTESLSVTTTVASASGCSLEGAWRLNDESFFEAVMALDPGAGVFEHVSGDYFIEFRSDGGYVETRDAWRFRVTSPDGVIEVETDGETPGTWTADADSFEIVASGEGTFTGSMWILEEGTLVPLPVSGSAMGVPGVIGLGTYGCTGGSLVLDVVAEDGEFSATFDPVG